MEFNQNLIEKEVSSEIVFDGKIFKIAKCKAELCNHQIVDREIMLHSGGVGILPLDENQNVLLVQQYRYGAYSFLWEIPLAVLSCNVLEIAFAEDMKILLYGLILCGTVAVSAASPKRLFIFFPVAVFAIFFENIYAVAAVWATIWCGVRIILCYFTTKQFNLQEHKI